MTWVVFAGVAVIMLLAVIFVLRRRVPDDGPGVTVDPGGDLNAGVRTLLGQDQKMEAVKLVRARTGLGLMDAKNYVERVEGGEDPAVPDRPASPSLDDEIAKLIESGNKVEAIKRIRAATGLGLKEAKDLVEEHRKR